MTPLDLMPPRSAWPVHAPRLVDQPHPIYTGRTRRYLLTPWVYRWGRRDMLARVLNKRTRYDESRPVARLWINGAGADHEIRFEVHPPRPSGALYEHYITSSSVPDFPDNGQLPVHGANNSWSYAPGLVLSSGSRVCARGISYFKTSDVLDVMRWADGLLDLWYPAAAVAL